MRLSTGYSVVVLVGLLPLVFAADDPCTEFAEGRDNRVTGLDAKLFKRCIQNVPFNPDKATETMRNLRMFLGLDTTAQYLIDPPTSELELSPFNLNKTMSKIDSKIKNNDYSNNWAFDYDVARMFQMFRDGHTDYETVCTHGYLYIHDYPIISIATDGDLPEIYHVEKDFNAEVWENPKLGAKIQKINGKAPEDYMADFIRNSPESLDWVDPDARYNEMLYGYPEGAARGRFARRNMWNGEDIRITWENGTDTIVEFQMQLTTSMVENGELLFSDTKSLADLCFLSDEEIKSAGGSKKRALGKKQQVDLLDQELVGRAAVGDEYAPDGYPTPLAYSKEHAMATYAVPGDAEAIVLNIRTFNEVALDSAEFVKSMSTFVKDQIAAWKTAGYKRLIIDVSNNRGGKAILPFDILKQLFPKDEDFLSLDMHYSPITWAYMYAINNGSEYEMYRDVNMKDFKDMKDFLGPIQKDGGYFSKMWKQDYVQFGEENYDFTIAEQGEQPFDASDISIISNSLCASACHSLVESLRARGVRAFAFGGRAIKSSPMQPVGGTKGGKVLGYEDVLSSLTSLTTNNNQDIAIAAVGPKDSWLLRPLPVRTKIVNINSENKFREGNKLPLQYVYTPACNRFFMEAAMLDDIAEVWRKTREIAWDDKGEATKCVDYEPIDNQDEFLDHAGSESKSGDGGDDDSDDDDGDDSDSEDGDGGKQTSGASSIAGGSIGSIIWQHMRWN